MNTGLHAVPAQLHAVGAESYGRETFLFSEIRVQIRVWPIDGRQWVARIGTVQGRTRRGRGCGPPPPSLGGCGAQRAAGPQNRLRSAGRRPARRRLAGAHFR